MEDNKALYNSRVIDTYIKLIKHKYSYVNISEVLSYAKMKAYEVADQGHWFSQEQVDLFYEKLVKVTGNANIAREAGRYAASPEALGVMRQYVLGLVGPASTFALLKQATSNFTKSSVYESKKIASNKVEITVNLNKGVYEKPYQCQNRIGYFESILLMFNHKLPSIHHTECMFKGDKVCKYIIKWENTPAAIWKKIRNYAILITSIFIIASIFLLSKYILTVTIPIALTLIMLIALISENIEKKDLAVAIDNVKDSTDNLLEQITVNYNNALLTNEIGQAISKQTHIEGILTSVIQILEKRLDYDRGLILLANDEKNKLLFINGFGYTEEQSQVLQKAVFHLDRPESKGAFIISFREQKPFLINDIDEIETSLSQNSLAFAKKMGTHSFICCPIISDEQSIGILAVDNVKTKKPLIQSDMSLLMGISHVIGISIRNALLLESRVMQFKSMLQVLAASIDARDNLTAGHSAKVTEYALGICSQLRLTSEYSEMIGVASMLHDYGKIGVPDAILKKPGRLTEEEREIVKSHSAKTREILEQINFEGIYRQVPEVAGSHHEKIDGSGYPAGLKGKEIPFGAKIIAVADFFEAITSKRHYREPMQLDVAVGLLKEGVGKHFDKNVVDAFLHYLRRINSNSSEEKFLFADHPLTRQWCSYPVSFRVNGVNQSGVCIDISSKGMFIANDDVSVQEGSLLEIELLLPSDKPTSMNIKGKAIWVNNKHEKVKPMFPVGFGVEFVETDISEDTMYEIINNFHEIDSSSKAAQQMFS